MVVCVCDLILVVLLVVVVAVVVVVVAVVYDDTKFVIVKVPLRSSDDGDCDRLASWCW